MRSKMLTKFMTKMKRSGYDERMRRRVLAAGMKGYERMVKEEEAGKRRVNRPRWEGAVQRRFKKLGAKANWFRSRKTNTVGCGSSGGSGGNRRERGKDEQTDIESVMFIPHTPGSLLAKMMQDEEVLFRKGTSMGKIKFVERGGISVKDILVRTNPWAREGCTREDCLPCLNERGKGGNCQKENIVYQISCQECAKKITRSEYTGETSRTGYLRGKEHLEGLKNRKEDSPLWKHCENIHSGSIVDFKMKVVRGHKTPLTRQIQESVEIQYSTADMVLNSKGEWNGSRIPRVVI